MRITCLACLPAMFSQQARAMPAVAYKKLDMFFLFQERYAMLDVMLVAI